MKKLDILYEAFKKYRSLTRNSSILSDERSLIINNNSDSDVFKVKKFQVVINNEWIKEIEENLLYIEKALDEERQFIRTNSEVVEIEKVKRVNRESVVDLAKHSEYITKEREDGNIIPDKILMVEKLSDFAVYENRFLYMLIVFIRNFIDFRLEKIQKIRKSYESNLNLTKEIKDSSREFEFNLTFNDRRSNNGYPIEDSDTVDKIIRLNNIKEILESFLKRQIMVDVSKTPMVKAPITKTNVLKNNNNFKRALALYEYLASYFDDGYEVKTIEYNFTPFDEKLGNYLAEIYTLTNYISYTFGNNLQEKLKNNYELKLAREKVIEEENLLKQINRIKKEIELESVDPYEYMLLLEKRMHILDEKLIDYNKALDVKEQLLAENEALNQHIFTLETRLKELEQEALARENELDKRILSLKESHREELLNLEEDFNNKILTLNLDMDNLKEEILSLNRERENYKYDLEAKFNKDRLALDKEYLLLKSELNLREEEINKELSETRAKIKEINGLHLAYLVSENKIKGNFTTKEEFNELENIFLMFAKFFKANFEKTKKEIRKELYWYDKQQDL